VVLSVFDDKIKGIITPELTNASMKREVKFMSRTVVVWIWTVLK
jgi:hypothetical protein